MEYQYQERDPMSITCGNCGSPTRFDIIRQTYRCDHCHTDNAIGPTAERLGQWREQHAREMEASSAEAEGYAVLTTCPNCGAEVSYPAGEAVSSCGFCGGALVRRAFTAQKNFPEMIIPFYITLDEAKARLREWCEKQKGNKTAKAALAAIDELKGYYLPYERVRGAVSYDVIVPDGETYPFRLAGYVDGVSVNASRQLDNDVLDKMEPFDWSALRPFEMGYMADQATKLYDVSDPDFQERLYKELSDHYEKTAEETLHNPNASLKGERADTIGMSILLPAYIIPRLTLRVAVNGQTGRVAVSDGLTKKDRRYLIEPSLITIASALLLFLGFRDAEVTVYGTAVIAAIAFTVFTMSSNRKENKIIYQSKATGAQRDDGALTIDKTLAPKEERFAKPEFFAKIHEDYVPVRIRYYRTARTLKWLGAGLLVNLLPAILALIITSGRLLFGEDLSVFSQIFWGGGAVWWFITIPVSIAYWLKFGRAELYRYPTVTYLYPDGTESKERVPTIGDSGVVSHAELMRLLFGWFGCLLLFLLIGSTLAMVMI